MRGGGLSIVGGCGGVCLIVSVDSEWSFYFRRLGGAVLQISDASVRIFVLLDLLVLCV